MESCFSIFLSYFHLTNNLFSLDLFYFGNQTLENKRKYFGKNIVRKQTEPKNEILKI